MRGLLLLIASGLQAACSAAPGTGSNGDDAAGEMLTTSGRGAVSTDATDGAEGGDVDTSTTVNSASSEGTSGASGGAAVTTSGVRGSTGGAATGSEGSVEGETTGASETCQESLSGCTDEHALDSIDCLEQVKNETESYCADQIIFHACNNEYGAGIVSCNMAFPECSTDTSNLECIIECSAGYIECLGASACANSTEAAETGCVTSLADCQSDCS